MKKYLSGFICLWLFSCGSSNPPAVVPVSVQPSPSPSPTTPASLVAGEGFYWLYTGGNTFTGDLQLYPNLTFYFIETYPFQCASQGSYVDLTPGYYNGTVALTYTSDTCHTPSDTGKTIDHSYSYSNGVWGFI